jgi:antitoxin component YwqK of YwqJK toxin-antitoxin module
VSLKIIYIACITFMFAFGCDKPLSFDAQGVPHGTGERITNYKSGAIKIREEYKNGELIQSRWFKPDGTLIEETNWKNGTGEGIYLRDDGSIRQRMNYVNGVAEGEATSYDEAGNATKVIYHAGKPVDEPSTSATQPAN